MDPNRVLLNLLASLEEGDRDEALSAAENLMDWIRRGGFLPDVKRGLPKVGEEWKTYSVRAT